MSLHRPCTHNLSSVANYRLSTALALLVFIGGAATADAASNPPECRSEIAATLITDGVPDAIRARVDRSVGRASVLARFDRADAAAAKLDALIALLDSPRG